MRLIKAIFQDFYISLVKNTKIQFVANSGLFGLNLIFQPFYALRKSMLKNSINFIIFVFIAVRLNINKVKFYIVIDIIIF